MDMFAIHPYLIPSKLPPTFAHPNTTTIGIADYPKLVRLLTNAFRGTAQRGETLPIVYDEFGYQSEIPVRKKSRLHTPRLADREGCDPRGATGDLLPAGVRARRVPADRRGPARSSTSPTSATRARGSRASTTATTRRSRACATVREAALDAQAGRLGHCRKAKTTTNLSRVVFHQPATELTVDFACVTVCSYEVQVIDSETGEKVAGEQGKSIGRHTVTFPTDDARAGQLPVHGARPEVREAGHGRDADEPAIPTDRAR